MPDRPSAIPGPDTSATPVSAPGEPPSAIAGLDPAAAPVAPLTHPSDLRGRAARGTLVNAVFLVGLNSLALLKGFVVAAFLTRSEYGVWGVIVVALGTLAWLKSAGVSDKYVQQQEHDQELAFQRAFTMECIFSGLLFALLVIASPIVALVYGQSNLLAPALVTALIVPAAILQSPLWVFYRRMEFVRQRALQAVDPIVSFLVTVGLAIAGAGYWSLVLGLLAGGWAAALVAMCASPYRVAWCYDAGTMRRYVGFSWPVVLAGGSGIIVAQASVWLGHLELGLAGVGAIALASNVSLYANRVDDIVTTTIYPAVCSVCDRVDLLFESFVKSNRLALMWGVPFGVGLALFAPDLVDYGMGARWRPAVGLLQAFGLIAAANHIGFNWTAYYRARGETRPLAIVAVITLLGFLVTAVPLLILDGLHGFAIGMGAMCAVGLVGRGYYLVRLFPGFRMLGHAARAIAPSVPATAAVLAARLLGGGRSPGRAVAELALYVLVTVAATWAFEGRLLREVVGYVRGGDTPRPRVAV